MVQRTASSDPPYPDDPCHGRLVIEPRPFHLFTGSANLAATLHRQAADLVEPQPAVLVTGSWLAVKEQMADLYAARLSARLGVFAGRWWPAGPRRWAGRCCPPGRTPAA
jgi:hypothetical protein